MLQSIHENLIFYFGYGPLMFQHVNLANNLMFLSVIFQLKWLTYLKQLNLAVLNGNIGIF